MKWHKFSDKMPQHDDIIVVRAGENHFDRLVVNIEFAAGDREFPIYTMKELSGCCMSTFHWNKQWSWAPIEILEAFFQAQRIAMGPKRVRMIFYDDWRANDDESKKLRADAKEKELKYKDDCPHRDTCWHYN